MTEYTSSIDIHAPPKVVWNIMADVEHWSSWTPTITSVTKLVPGPLALGTAAKIIQPKLPPAVWRVTEIHEGRDFTWINRTPGLRVIGGHAIQPTPDGCRVTVSIRFAGFLAPIIGRLVRRLNENYLATEARGLKARAEALARAVSR